MSIEIVRAYIVRLDFGGIDGDNEEKVAGYLWRAQNRYGVETIEAFAGCAACDPYVILKHKSRLKLQRFVDYMTNMKSLKKMGVNIY